MTYLTADAEVTDALAQATRQELIEETKNSRVPYTEKDIDVLVQMDRKDAFKAWSGAVGQCRNYLRDPKWWQGTYLDRALNPPDQPPLPNNPLPKPVYVSKRNPELVLALENNFVKMWMRR